MRITRAPFLGAFIMSMVGGSAFAEPWSLEEANKRIDQHRKKQPRKRCAPLAIDTSVDGQQAEHGPASSQ